ncbi:MAG: ATP-dependent Clp protease ATP-binding subunit, partial [Clostridia bacterium]|nr:ATP-dependent Clp protease ATP-binding subunit [Clostridia bacterium]
MQNRLTKKAQNALTKSLAAAEELGHTYVGTEHLLIGLAEEEDSAAARILDGKGITPLRIRDAVREISGAGSRTSLSASEMTPRARTVIEEAGRVADDLSGGFVGTEHVLSAICREKECTGYRILVSFSADPGQIVREIGQIAGGSAPKTEKNPTETDGEIPTLLRFGIDLTASARAGKLDPVIGRTRETARLIAILCRKTKNTPCLVGEPGVGKTAVVEGLAQKIVSGDVPEPLLDRRIVSLDLSSMIAGAKYRGEFEERMRGIIDEATKHPGVILFIDEVHTLIGAGAAEGAVDAANILKPALARGAIRLIGATTPDEYERHIERDSALERRFQPVPVREPDRDETLAVLRGIRGKLEEHHGVKLPDGALEAAITLSVRYLPDKYLPDKAIDLLDEAAARLWLSGLPSPAAVRELQREIDELRASLERAVVERDFEQAAVLRDRERVLTARRDALLREREEQRSRPPVLSYDDLAAVLTDGTGIPVCRMKEENKLDYNAIVAGLSRRIVGQDEAICAVSHAVCRGRLGLSDARRPIGSFLFLGPTGVGKTELSRALAETVFGSPSALLRFDMTEYRESHSISRRLGSPPGYVGHE